MCRSGGPQGIPQGAARAEDRHLQHTHRDGQPAGAPRREAADRCVPPPAALLHVLGPLISFARRLPGAAHTFVPGSRQPAELDGQVDPCRLSTVAEPRTAAPGTCLAVAASNPHLVMFVRHHTNVCVPPSCLVCVSDEAIDSGITVAVCSTSNERAVSNIVKVNASLGRG